jgi:hypothetical protein
VFVGDLAARRVTTSEIEVDAQTGQSLDDRHRDPPRAPRRVRNGRRRVLSVVDPEPLLPFD